MKNKKFWLGVLIIVSVFGMSVIGCQSYMDMMDRTTPGWREMEPIQVFPGDSPGGGSSRGSGSSGGRGSSGSSGSSGESSTTVPQQPSSTSETIIRSYSFNFPAGGQAGAEAEAVANATERFMRENPGFDIINIQSENDWLGTLTVTITGRK